MRHFIGGPTLWQRTRRRIAATAVILLAAVGTVTLQNIPNAAAGLAPSVGCADANLAANDGTNLGRTDFPAATTRSFQKNDKITIKADAPTGANFKAIRVIISHAELNTVEDVNTTQMTLPSELSFTFPESRGYYVRWYAVNTNNAVINATWDISCTPTTSTLSPACEDAREEPVRTYAGAGYPGDVPFGVGDRLVVTSSNIPNSQPITKTYISTEAGGSLVKSIDGPGAVGYTITAADVGKLVSWGIFGGNASWVIYCYPPAQSLEYAANVIGHAVVKVNGVEVVSQDVVNAYIGPNDSVPNALASGEQSTRNGLLALGYEGPITCTTDTTQSGTQPDEFRNVGSQDRTLQPTSDTYVEIYVTKYRITCTQTAVAPCGDNAPTPAGYSLVKGTAGNDNLIGGSGKQIIKGLGGNDRISDLSGDDIICGGPGDDTLSGGGGNDLLLGGTGNDSLDGSSGTDTGYDPDSGTRYTSIEKVL